MKAHPNGLPPGVIQPVLVAKKITGIRGFDEISRGGLPENRLTVIMGSAGAGKTVFALQTMVNRLKILGEACLFVTFEEPISRIRINAAAFDWEFSALDQDQFRFVDARIQEDVSDAFDLSTLLARLKALKEETGATNIVFDGIDVLLSTLQDEQWERKELRRLDTWIRESGMSALMTVKSFGPGERDQSRVDFLQYLSDCRIILAGTVTETSSSRTLRISKYRGSGFSANPAPVVLSESGFEVIMTAAPRSDYPTFTDRVSSGVPRLDALLNGGYLRGSSTLISGSPGTSKTSLGASLVAAACARKEKALVVSFDESGAQIVRNMKSIGIDLDPYVAQGLLVFESLLSNESSPEEHFVTIRRLLDQHAPNFLVIDPISSLLKAEYPFAPMICESLLNQAKAKGITFLCTSLLDKTGDTELSASLISTIADTWIHVSNIASEGERNRALTIVKSRGTDNSNQVRELVLSGSGVDLVDVYVAEGEVLMGSARAQKESEAIRLKVLEEIEARRRGLALERELTELRARAEASTLEVRWKEEEAELDGALETGRLTAQRDAASERLHLRRSGDDAVVVALPGVKGRQ
jgi:circadian clock protein KaiC